MLARQRLASHHGRISCPSAPWGRRLGPQLPGGGPAAGGGCVRRCRGCSELGLAYVPLYSGVPGRGQSQPPEPPKPHSIARATVCLQKPTPRGLRCRPLTGFSIAGSPSPSQRAALRRSSSEEVRRRGRCCGCGLGGDWFGGPPQSPSGQLKPPQPAESQQPGLGPFQGPAQAIPHKAGAWSPLQPSPHQPPHAN